MKIVTTAASPAYDFGNCSVVYADGIASIDQSGPNSHVVFYMSQKIEQSSGQSSARGSRCTADHPLRPACPHGKAAGVSRCCDRGPGGQYQNGRRRRHSCRVALRAGRWLAGLVFSDSLEPAL
jgi:hypothetical protein